MTDRAAIRAERAARNLARLGGVMAQIEKVASDPHTNKRAAVICWDLTHNPVGRAHVLVRLLQHDWHVDLVGPMWDRFGTSLWAPLTGQPLSVRTFPCSDVTDFLPAAMATAVQEKYDLVVCCKSRLPGVHLAMLMAEWSNAPLLCDLDDDELAFADQTSDADREAAQTGVIGQLLDVPASDLAERALVSFDALTIVSRPLQDRYGGITVRHARAIGPAPGSSDYRQGRELARANAGITADEFALLFVGTVREHKGVPEVVAALQELGRDDVRLHIYSSNPEAEIRRQVERHVAGAEHRYVTHGPCSLTELPGVMLAADLVVLAQDPSSPISKYQVPAKVSDAAAVGCPVLVPDIPVFADLATAGLVEVYGHGELTSCIREIVDRPLGEAGRAALQQRFAGELGEPVNQGRMRAAVEAAAAAHSPSSPRRSAQLHDEMGKLYVRTRSLAEPTGRDLAEGAEASDAAHPLDTAPASGGPRQAPRPKGVSSEAATGDAASYDLAFFWKQNDSDIYGRRSDLIVSTALASGRVRRAVHFDGALASDRLREKVDFSPRELPTEADFVLPNIVERALEARDESHLKRRCYLYDPNPDPERPARLFGREVGGLADYGSYVRAQLEAAGLEPERTIAWVWPAVHGLDQILRDVTFGAVVCDIVDDQRTWPDLASSYRAELDDAYRTAIGAADLILTNSPANADAFAEFGRAMTVIPNGAEPAPRLELPARQPDVGRPTVGYVGNMRDRVDWDLIEDVASMRPDWTFVLVGEAPPHLPAHDVAQRCTNVRLTGVVPYRRARAMMTAFDVGIVPHLLTEQSFRMDPLKLYNMVAMGLPVVSTAHPTAVGLSQYVSIADDAASFVEAIESALGRGRAQVAEVDMSGISWQKRVAAMFDLIDALPEARRCRI